MWKVCREVDAFFTNIAAVMPSSKNVELGGRDGTKYLKHGVTAFMVPKIRRINGGWWISIARQFRIFYCFTDLVGDATRKRYGNALHLLLQVHHALRDPLYKGDLNKYDDTISQLLDAMITICKPHTKSKCNSFKFH
jgi:hypothetical protein